MESIAQLEASVVTRPNSIEINHALADAYIKQGRWKEATETYQALISLYPATASLFVNRIRLGAAALAISSCLILLAQGIRPSLLNVQTNPSDLASALTSNVYLVAQILFLLAFPLFSTAAISIYKLLSYSRDHRPAFAAMVFSVIGVGLSMPALGINAVVLPLIGKIYLGGEASVLSLYLAMQNFPQLLILKLGGYLLLIGIAIFSWVIWRNESLSTRGAMLYLLGWILFVVSNDHLSTAGSLSIGLLIALGGITLARAIWIQAPLQFAPKTDSTQKADS
ncbi:MAG: tetratricopeptide repeat protein [Chloroflexota bacterium]|nr:tetratricopeptide repeat protein [Chloroflexota bacterium]